MSKLSQIKFSHEDYLKHFTLKKEAMEKILGPMHNMVGHAIIPFDVGGLVDMYRFPKILEGTTFATMELIEPDGSGPKPSHIGTFELVACTSISIDDKKSEQIFNMIELHICSILTSVARLSHYEQLNPLDTCEVPSDTDGKQSLSLVFDEWKSPNAEFRIGPKKHGLLLCIEIFRSEMEYAMQNGSDALLDRLKKEGYYPYSDLNRESVV